MLEVAEAFLSSHWGGFLWRMLIGVLYAIGGGVLIADPLAASVMMTLVFAAVLIASGAMRVFLPSQIGDALAGCCSRRASSAFLRVLLSFSNGRSADCGSLVWWLASTYCCMASGGWCLAGKIGKSSVLPRDDTSRSPRSASVFDLRPIGIPLSAPLLVVMMVFHFVISIHDAAHEVLCSKKSAAIPCSGCWSSCQQCSPLISSGPKRTRCFLCCPSWLLCHWPRC